MTLAPAVPAIAPVLVVTTSATADAIVVVTWALAAVPLLFAEVGSKVVAVLNTLLRNGPPAAGAVATKL